MINMSATESRSKLKRKQVEKYPFETILVEPSITNTLSSCIDNGFTLDVKNNEYIILSINKYEHHWNGKFIIYGNCVSSNMNISKQWVDPSSQPKEAVVELIAKLKCVDNDSKHAIYAIKRL